MRLRGAIATANSRTWNLPALKAYGSMSGTALSCSVRFRSAHRRRSFQWCESRGPYYSARKQIYRKILHQQDGSKNMSVEVSLLFALAVIYCVVSFPDSPGETSSMRKRQHSLSTERAGK